jgi:hypothetical protein
VPTLTLFFKKLVVAVAALGLTVVAGAVAVVAAAPAWAGTDLTGATLTDANNNPIGTTPLASTQTFKIVLPSGAACTHSTAAAGFHVGSFLVNTSAGDPAAYQYGAGGPLNGGFGLSTPLGGGYQNVNTNTDATINPPPAFGFKKQFAAYHTGGSGTAGQLYQGSWNMGISCTDASAPAHADNVWNIPVTFTDSTSDPNHFTWELRPTGVPTTTTLKADPPGQAPRGTAITLTATVSATSVPAGTVEFFYGKASLGSTSLAGGVAVFTPKVSFPVGAATFSAVFTPTDTNAFQGSTSNTLTYTVTATGSTSTTTSTTTPATTSTTTAPASTTSPSTGSASSNQSTDSPSSAGASTGSQVATTSQSTPGSDSGALAATGMTPEGWVELAVLLIVVGGVLCEFARQRLRRSESG